MTFEEKKKKMFFSATDCSVYKRNRVKIKRPSRRPRRLLLDFVIYLSVHKVRLNTAVIISFTKRILTLCVIDITSTRKILNVRNRVESNIKRTATKLYSTISRLRHEPYVRMTVRTV